MPKILTHQEKVERALGRRPLPASKVGQKLGYRDHRPVGRALAKAVAEGRAVKTEKGYARS